MGRKFKVAGIGEILWDIYPNKKMLGGAPANFAFHAKSLNADGIIISAVGNDKYGKEILAETEKMGIINKFLQVKFKIPTGSVYVDVDNYGKPNYKINKNVAWDRIVYTPVLEKLAGEIDAVCFGTLAQRSFQSRTAINEFLKHTNKNCLKIFDINLRGNFYNEEIISKSLQLADCMKLNDEELIIVSEVLGISGAEKTVIDKIINNYELKFIVLTKGEGGSKMFMREYVEDLPSRIINVVDTIGDGDAFTAALVVSLLNGFDPLEAHFHTAKLAEFVRTKQGAMPKIDEKMIEKFTNI